MFHGPVARAGSCGNASSLPFLRPCLSPSYTCVSPPLSLARNATLVHTVSSACVQLDAGLAPGCLGSKSPRWSYNYFPHSSSRVRPGGKKVPRCTWATTPWHAHDPALFFFWCCTQLARPSHQEPLHTSFPTKKNHILPAHS